MQPPKQAQPHYFRLLISFTHLVFSLANVHCDNFADRNQVPSATDCRQILAHLPALPPLHLRNATGNSPLSASSPFLPNIVFHRGNCLLTTETGCHADGDYHTPTALATFMDMLSHLPQGKVLRPETSIFMVWMLIRDLARRVMEECVEGRQVPGDGDGEFAVPGLDGAIRWAVSVSGTRDRGWMETEFVRPQEQRRAALEWGQRPGRPPGWEPYRFVEYDEAFYWV